MEEGDLPGSSPRSGQEEELAGPGRIFSCTPTSSLGRIFGPLVSAPCDLVRRCPRYHPPEGGPVVLAGGV